VKKNAHGIRYIGIDRYATKASSITNKPIPMLRTEVIGIAVQSKTIKLPHKYETPLPPLNL